MFPVLSDLYFIGNGALVLPCGALLFSEARGRLFSIFPYAITLRRFH